MKWNPNNIPVYHSALQFLHLQSLSIQMLKRKAVIRDYFLMRLAVVKYPSHSTNSSSFQKLHSRINWTGSQLMPAPVGRLPHQQL